MSAVQPATCDASRKLSSTCTHAHRVFQSSQLQLTASRPPRPSPPAKPVLKASSAPGTAWDALHNATRAPRLARKEAVSLVLRLLKLPACGRREAAVHHRGTQHRLSQLFRGSRVHLEVGFRGQKMTWAPGACSCASGATIRLLRVARKWSLVLRL